MATITTGSEKQVIWAQQLMDERISHLTTVAGMVEGASADAIRATVAMLEKVTDARPVIDHRGKGAEVVLHAARVALLGSPEWRTAHTALSNASAQLSSAQRMALMGL